LIPGLTRWSREQEHAAATVVQANWRGHRAKTTVGNKRTAQNAAAAKIQRQYRTHTKTHGGPGGAGRRPGAAGGGGGGGVGKMDDEDVMLGTSSMDFADETFSVVRPTLRGQTTLDQIVISRKVGRRRFSPG
jgi:hypothetical protein